MKAREIERKFLNFFKSKKHSIIPGASLIPEHDPTVLFTTAGMHPLVPYLLGQKHPSGKNLANNQICVRTDDVDEVGDSQHLTFFEMLGNWSLGDYWKEDAIKYSYELLTKHLKLDQKKLAISVFKGDKDAPRDKESAKIWQEVGIPKQHIFYFSKKENWWGPAGQTGPCGPCTEMFYWNSNKKVPKRFDPDDDKWMEIWNDVFMQYNKDDKGKYTKLKQKNVDTGFGLERAAAIMQKKDNVFETDLFFPIIKKIRNLSKKKNTISERIIADHLRASAFILSELIQPSNVEHGYILRRLLRRSIRHSKILDIKSPFIEEVIKVVINNYKNRYKKLKENKDFILKNAIEEEQKFQNVLTKGINVFNREIRKLKNKIIPGKLAFTLFTSYGFPLEITKDLAKEKNMEIDEASFNKLFKKHQQTSRTAAAHKFKAGLADHSERTIKLHTATHLLNAALRIVLGKHVKQMGSNITKERLRFDFSHNKKLSEKEIKKVEDLVNKQIKKAINIEYEELPYKIAVKKGALSFFRERYPEIVKVYSVGKFSKEICAGPHVRNTKQLKKFKILKEEASAAGVRRIKASVS